MSNGPISRPRHLLTATVLAAVVAAACAGDAPPADNAAAAPSAPPTAPPAASPAPAPQASTPAIAPAPPPAAVRTRSAEDLLRTEVKSWGGTPFKDDGKTRSGIGNAAFTQALLRGALDLEIPASRDDQNRAGRMVERSALAPGDLVFFEGGGIGPFKSKWVGVYVGRNEVALAHKDVGVAVVKLAEKRWDSSYKAAHRISAQAQSAPVFDPGAFGANRAALLREIAKAWQGTLYLQGGTTFDGIGNDEFVREVYEAINDSELDGRPKQWATAGKAVKKEALEPGDIILYEAVGIGKLVNQRHAGLYIGDGEFVHAVKGAAVTISKLKDKRWAEAYRAARRIEPRDDQDEEAAAVANSGGNAARPSSSASRTGAERTVVARDMSEHERRLREATEPWKGTPYKIGGTSKSGVDCSAFVRAIYGDVYGVPLPRTSEEQERLGEKVNRGDLQAGDLIFFRTQGMGPFFKSRHVGVYLGGGEFAQSSGSLGVNVARLDNRYWNKKYSAARRLPKG